MPVDEQILLRSFSDRDGVGHSLFSLPFGLGHVKFIVLIVVLLSSFSLAFDVPLCLLLVEEVRVGVERMILVLRFISFLSLFFTLVFAVHRGWLLLLLLEICVQEVLGGSDGFSWLQARCICY